LTSQQTDTEWRLAVDLPGLSKCDILIELDRGMLRIQAHRAYEQEQEGVIYTLQERTHGAVCRVLQLPDTVSAKKSKVTAKYEHGVLYITLEKRQPWASTTVKQIELHWLCLLKQ
jgi:HSP20 family protein